MRVTPTTLRGLVILIVAALTACGAAGGDAGTVDALDGVAETTEAQDALDASEATAPKGCLNAGTAGATARCLTPQFPAEYYVEEANRYFDTLDLDADRDSVPAYSELVARWEWPPWLLLTGYGKQNLIETAEALLAFDPSTVPFRDCRFFEVQPFARCYVEFEYEGGPCPIYEEFTFNDQGETTFIEAWSNLPGMLPFEDPEDPWAEGPDIHRLATRVPGLGHETGLIDLDSTWMIEAAASDAELADFALRATDMWLYWYELLNARPEDFFGQGCGW